MLDKRQIECIKLMTEGIPVMEISKKIGVSRTTIYDWKKQEEFAAELDRIEQEFISSAIYKLKRAAPVAADKLIKLLNGKYEKTQLSAAIDLLDRTAGKATTKVEVSNDKDSKSVSKDILESEFNEVDNK